MTAQEKPRNLLPPIAAIGQLLRDDPGGTWTDHDDGTFTLHHIEPTTLLIWAGLDAELARLREALVHERALCIAADPPSRYMTNAEYDAMARAELIREGLLPPD